jgi:hypothetical protein
MKDSDSSPYPAEDIIEQVDGLSEEVKVLALNLAIYLAKAKPQSNSLTRLEPDFIRLVNGTVKAVQEISRIIQAARDQQPLAFDVPSGAAVTDQIEVKLRSILNQCGRIMTALGQAEDMRAPDEL